MSAVPARAMEMSADAAAMRRGACPSLPEPMPTGDGLLARLQPAAPLTPDQLAGLARLACECGNGIVEVTARGKLQLRGLTAESAARLPAGVDALGIVPVGGFPVETGALAGLDPAEAFDPRPLAQAISEGAAGLVPRLAPKVSVVVDGGGTLHPGALKADIALTAGGRGRVLVRLAGLVAGEVARERAAEVTVGLLARLAGHGATARMDGMVRQEGMARLRAAFGLDAVPEPHRPPAEPVGLHALNDGSFAFGIAPPFGQATAGALERLTDAVRASGARHVEPAAGRALLIVGLARGAAELLAREAAALGFIVDPSDPLRRVAACPGAPACASARIETRALATALAPLLAGSGMGGELHVSGCAKGCAHPARAALTIVGLDAGAGIVVEGTPRDAPARIVPLGRLDAELRELLARDVMEDEFLKKDPA
ncbi:precorrin-3B synthase [Ancylobacter sp. MQZ15Z-1]|uniref:Precorrin-3B synthase n=1 Tax=Ancylobacter mangrovi TaxID=2972472 RepID=A0A9X2PM86_9HYPH|nr:precorrin-3B synthase [Ancylobacter mangrovi]MCS0496378.1 precorrin-3B synthase [Ancylobacter mangrovi]